MTFATVRPVRSNAKNTEFFRDFHAFIFEKGGNFGSFAIPARGTPKNCEIIGIFSGFVLSAHHTNPLSAVRTCLGGPKTGANERKKSCVSSQEWTVSQARPVLDVIRWLRVVCRRIGRHRGLLA